MKYLALLVLAGIACDRAFAAEALPELLEVRKIWDQGKHNAFPDLIQFQDQFFCVFREGDGHIGGDGKARVLVSKDGDKWESAALLDEAGIDLRDPKFSIMTDGRLMLVMGGSVFEGKDFKGMQPRVSFSADGRKWSVPQRILGEGDWLWRVTWHEGTAYGINKRIEPRPDTKCHASLIKSSDGLQWERVGDLEVSGNGRASETTLRFLPDDTMVALMRKSDGDKIGWIGTSRPPYREWTWHSAKHRRLDGPNFLRLPDGSLWATSRDYQPPTEKEKPFIGNNPTVGRTVVARMTPQGEYTVMLTLPSFGDTGYTGLAWHDDLLWVSYYSSHEGKPSIYLAKVKLPLSK